jgi:hypothetical protein
MHKQPNDQGRNATRPSSRQNGHAPPPDDAGHQGAFTREEPLSVSDDALPGSTWESPREGERAEKTDWGLQLVPLLLVLAAAALFAYCATVMP